jgi:tRNA A-37 threonylcarbamoyl transferase component Bud32
VKPAVASGEILAGKYEIERVLGSGGMGIVLAARHTQLAQRVAIKLMRHETALSEDGVARFMREGRAAVRLRGENVARVLDVGMREDGTPYLVMEYLDGIDLAMLLKRDGPLPVATTVAYVRQACTAMAEAHAQGIVHRDLKPQNLFLTTRPDGTPLIKVLDFGISKMAPELDPEDVSRTATSMILGSPAYISPEQASSSKDVDARTDIWSLGAILYQLLSGQLPFDGDSLPQIFARLYYEPPAPLREYAPWVPAALEQVILRCLTRDLDQRYQSVTELDEALAPFVGWDAAGASLPEATARAASQTVGVLQQRPASHARSVRAWRIAAVAGVLLGACMAVLLFLVLGRDRDPGPAPGRGSEAPARGPVPDHVSDEATGGFTVPSAPAAAAAEPGVPDQAGTMSETDQPASDAARGSEAPDQGARTRRGSRRRSRDVAQPDDPFGTIQ